MDEIHFIFSRFRHAWHLGFGGCCCCWHRWIQLHSYPRIGLIRRPLTPPYSSPWNPVSCDFCQCSEVEVMLTSTRQCGSAVFRFYSGQKHGFFIGGRQDKWRYGQMRRIWMDGASLVLRRWWELDCFFVLTFDPKMAELFGRLEEWKMGLLKNFSDWIIAPDLLILSFHLSEYIEIAWWVFPQGLLTTFLTTWVIWYYLGCFWGVT